MAAPLALLALVLTLAESPSTMASDETTLASFLARPGHVAHREAAWPGLTVLNVAAHPDDEDGASLTYLGHHYNYRTHILYTTRGEGGQNEIGDALGDHLGVIRSQECQAAATGYGARISFLNALDFGFAKTAHEAEARWGWDQMVERTVEELRRLDVDVILTHHTPDTGHGHHRATSNILRAAVAQLVATASDAPVLLERSRTPGADTVELDSGVAAPGLPWTYAGWAHVALRRHKSQGMGLSPVPTGPLVKWYRVVAGASEERVAAWRADPAPWGPAALRALANRTHQESGSDRSSRLARAARWESGHRPDANVSPAWLRLGDAATVEVHPPSTQILSGLEVEAPTGFSAEVTSLTADRASIEVRATSEPSWPAHAFVRSGRAVADSLDCTLTYEDGLTEPIRVALPERVPVAFLVLQPAPPVRPHEPIELRGTWFGDATEQLSITAPLPLELVWGEGDPLSPAGQPLQILLEGATTSGQIDVTWEHPWTTGASTVHVLDVEVPAARVGFVEGVDGGTGRALERLGVDVRWLGEGDLASADLSEYDVVLVDIRAYLVRDDLRAHNARLLDYARGGGHLVVQYQKTFEWNDVSPPFAPYDLQLGRDRVVDEAAPMRTLDPTHPFWHWPHRLDDDDWNDWVQERGLYFPARWDERYQAIVSVNDAEESALTGGVLTAPWGAGHFTYSSLVWYRQLRAGVPGAYRAFLNLLFWTER